MPTLTFWVDVDNTLLDNDKIKQDFDEHIQVELGPRMAQRFWNIYEEVRHERSVVDIPLSLRRLREQTPLSDMDEQTYQHVYSIFDNYPFFKALYPYTLETLHYLETLGQTVIVSDGDDIFQAEKIVNSDLAEAVQGRVLLYVHKQEHLNEIMERYPADHYVIIDDKPSILVDAKAIMGNHLTTVFVKQGKYASQLPEHFTADISVLHIADVRNYSAAQLYAATKTA